MRQILVAVAVLLLFVAPFAGIVSWVERRIAGRMMDRVGPNRVGPQGFFQWIADGIKSLLKEDIIPTAADPVLFRMAPYLVFCGMFAASWWSRFPAPWWRPTLTSGSSTSWR